MAQVSGQSQSHLLYVWDRNSGHKLLVDTGAQVSVFPASAHERRSQKTEPLIAANGSTIDTFGKRTIPLDLGFRKFAWSFVLADVKRPMLGADFFCSNHLLIDVYTSHIIDAKTYESVPVWQDETPAPGLNACSAGNEFADILKEFPSVTRPQFSTGDVKHSVEHCIPTSGPPVHAKARRLSPEKLATARREFAEMEKLGIIRRSSSPWASPLHMVEKKTPGTWRPCGDYRRLNKVTTHDRYPVPRLQDFASQLKGKKIFSKVDFVRGYNQIPVAAADVPKTAVITPFGLFEFLRMPFGLKNAAQAFQRFMDQVCRGLEDFLFVYIDDVLVASPDAKEHRRHLHLLFQRLAEHGLVVNVAKCTFGEEIIDFLAHRVTAQGIEPLPERVEAIRRFPRPQNAKTLSEFLGMVNFYHRFIPNAAALMGPLHGLSHAKGQDFQWTTQHQSAFDATKHALASATLLNHPSATATTCITVDASDLAVGGVLEQFLDGNWRPLAFFSRKLDKAQKSYSTFDRELLAMYSAVQHFSYFIEGRRFHIYTDHKPLTFALASSSERWTPRQQRHLAFIAEYTTDVRHVHGRDNAVADALSRVELGTHPVCMAAGRPSLDLLSMAQAQQADAEVQAYRTAITGLVLADVPLPGTDTTLLCDTSTGTARPIVPRSWRRAVFEAIHSLAHPGIKTSRKMVTARFVWHGINKQVGMWAKTCISCQKSKVQRHVTAPLEHGQLPDRRFQRIHVDVVGPLPISQGKSYLFTIIDRYTRWPEAIPMADATATSCARALMSHHIAQFGVPTDITSDRGPQFTSNLWTTLGKLLGAQLHHTTAYHPQANGIVERFHRQLKSALKARLVGSAWMDELPLVLLGLRSAPKEGLGCAPAELVYGTTIRLPGEFFECTPAAESDVSDLLIHLRNTMARLRPKQTSHHRRPSTHIPAELQSCTFVFVRHDAHRTPLQCTYDGPFKVLERAAKFFTLDLNGRRDTVSVDRLKPAFLDADWGLGERPGSQPSTRVQQVPPIPSSTSEAIPLLQDKSHTPLRIVKRSRAGREIRPPVKLQ